MTLALVLRARAILLGSKAVIVGFFLSVNEDRVGIGDFFEDILGAFVMTFVPSY